MKPFIDVPKLPILDAAKLPESVKRRLRQIAKEKGPEEAMEYADKLLEGFGVEVIWGNADPYSFRSKPDLLYVNMGDPYVPTVIYDNVSNRFLWGLSWGDIVEKRNYT